MNSIKVVTGCYAVRLVAIALLCLTLAFGLDFRYQRVQLVRVIDADTVVLNIEVEPGLVRNGQSCRLLRIDAPELNTAAGQEAKVRLSEFLADKALVVETNKRDNFGRWLIELYANGASVSDWLLAQALARPYP